MITWRHPPYCAWDWRMCVPARTASRGCAVCLSAYTFLYVPVGRMYLDMTPEGVHSNAGGMLPRSASCWE